MDGGEHVENQGKLDNNVIEPVHIDIEDIQEELDFWSSSIICYVVGVNPSVQMIHGFLRRAWKAYNVDKVAMIKKVIFLVTFRAMASKDKVLEVHFDKKPVIVKPWIPKIGFEKDDLKTL